MISETNWAMPEDYPEEEETELSIGGVKMPLRSFHYEIPLKVDDPERAYHAIRTLFNKPEDWN